ncbi:MAG: aminodeoxychorismate synthase component I [Deltaproteobacteria bacterium]|nr:aminodeoxychorismate synthase component I [Deltaproteobacteria bacterium]
MLIEEMDDIAPVAAFAAMRRMAMPFILSGSPAWKRRYSYVGAAPVAVIRTEAGKTTSGTLVFRDPFEAVETVLQKERDGWGGPLRHDMRSRKTAAGNGLSPFSGGAVGYLGYGLNGVIEPRLSVTRKGVTCVPDALIGIYETVYVYDHEEARGCLTSSGRDMAGFNKIKDLLRRAKTQTAPEPLRPSGGMAFNMTRGQYLRMIERAKAYISAGDVYQINLAQRISVPVEGDPLSLFLRLLDEKPAPYPAFMDLGGFQIISNSPELLLSVRGNGVETSPIKGTRPRGHTLAEDRAMINELKSSRKERAEHVMIVDLERSDLGRVCLPGSVEVAAFEAVESYEHLHHMASTVRGRLRPGITSAGALRSCFPGGSVTGAPKVRAMEIIAELEPEAREIYTGGMGWIGFDGEMDMAMTIRTAVVKDGELRLHVGGGIVADSAPEDEYAETMLKARDFLEALGIAEARTA